jgi:transcriptional regulator with XRE-family HTH domain
MNEAKLAALVSQAVADCAVGGTVDMMTTAYSLGERIYLLRRRKDWTQKDLADRVGLSPNTIARVERNVVGTLRGDTIACLARQLGTSTDYLLGLTDKLDKESEVEPATPEPVPA